MSSTAFLSNSALISDSAVHSAQNNTEFMTCMYCNTLLNGHWCHQELWQTHPSLVPLLFGSSPKQLADLVKGLCGNSQLAVKFLPSHITTGLQT